MNQIKLRLIYEYTDKFRFGRWMAILQWILTGIN